MAVRLAPAWATLSFYAVVDCRCLSLLTESLWIYAVILQPFSAKAMTVLPSRQWVGPLPPASQAGAHAALATFDGVAVAGGRLRGQVDVFAGLKFAACTPGYMAAHPHDWQEFDGCRVAWWGWSASNAALNTRAEPVVLRATRDVVAGAILSMQGKQHKPPGHC